MARPKLKAVCNIGDEDGIYIFNDDSMLFWTSGRGGFVVEGGLGFWPKTGDVVAKMEAYTKYAEEDLDDGGFGASMVNSWADLPEDIRTKAKEAFQSLRDGKYCLANRLNNPPPEEE